MSNSLSPAIHNISFCGLTGVIFALVTAAMILYLEAFVTTSWVVHLNTSMYNGLFQTCTYTNGPFSPAEGWFKAVQVLITCGLFGIFVSFVLATIYMSANRASKNLTLIALVFISFITVGLISIGLIVLGANKSEDSGSLSWSFAVTVAALLLMLLAAILTVMQIRRSNVRIC